MTCEFIRPNGRRTTVKNLAWLRRHLGIYTVRQVTVKTYPGQGATLFVHFLNGIDFIADFASADILRGWLNARRNLKGVLLVWDGVEKIIGG